MKDSYQIARLLKKMFRQGFNDTFQQPTLSEKSKSLSDAFQKKHQSQSTSATRKSCVLPDKSPKGSNRFVRYQKELMARRLIKAEPPPEKPGEIIKLPLDFPIVKPEPIDEE